MKIRPLLIALSLVANAALLFAVNRSRHWVDFSSDANSAAPAIVASASDRAAARAAAAAAAGRIDPEMFADITAGELHDVVARLQAGGFPPSLQRAILGALITERFADRHKALAQVISAQPWWVQINVSASGSKVITMRQQIYREEKDLLEQMLGPDAGSSEYARARRPRQYGDLPAAKMSELDRISADYNELMQEVRMASQNILLPEDREKIAYLEKEKRADMAKLLTTEEMFEYDLRSGPSAGTLRSQLTAFNPSEDEYRALFKLQQVFDGKYPSPEAMTPDQRRQRMEAQADLTKQAEAVLTPERYAEYQQKTDQVYLQTNALITRLQLPPTVTTELVALQKDITKRADALRTDRSMAADLRNAQLGALGAEASVRAGAVIGEANLPAYKQSAGSWIAPLQRAATPSTPTPKN